MLDDIGVEWFDLYGIGKLYCTDPSFQYCRTPVLDALARSGVLFREAYADPICGPTRAGLQTGLQGFRTGFAQNIRDPQSTPIPPERIGDALSTQFDWVPRRIETSRPGELDTAAIGKWHLADAYSSVVAANPPPAPDEFLDHPRQGGYGHAAVHLPNYGCAYSWYRVVDGDVDPPAGYVAPPFTIDNWVASVNARDAADWIRTRTKPWFLYLAFNPPHVPLRVPPFELLGRTTIGELQAAGLAPGSEIDPNGSFASISLGFRAAMESIDSSIGNVLRAITPVERARTTIIVCGDNGTVRAALPPGFVHAKREVYRGGTQVPLVVSGPSVVQPNRSTNALVHTVDVAATVLDLAGVPPPASPFDGISLVPLMKNAPGRRTRVLTETFRPFGETTLKRQVDVSRALYDGRWRYVYLAQAGGNPLDPPQPGFRRELLFDDSTDFLETQDVSASHPDVVEQMRKQMAAILTGP